MRTIKQLINSYCNNNGSFITVDVLLSRWRNENSLPETSFQEELLRLKNSGEVELEGNRVYLRRVWLQEEYAANRLSALLAAPPPPPIMLPSKLGVGDITLTDEQRSAVQTCLSHWQSTLQGPAGSGKTSVAQAIIQYGGAQNCLLCSPTGKAAKNLTNHTGLPAATVHRTLGVRCIDDFLDVERMDDIDLILVDEGGMLTLEMYAGLLRAASPNCRIVIMGDRNQLPAVGPGDVMSELVTMGFPTARLTQNHRQNQGSYALRKNVLGFDSILEPWYMYEDDSFRLRYSEDPDSILNHLVQEAVDRYHSGNSVQVVTFRRDDVLELNRRIQQQVNPITPCKRILAAKGFVFADNDRVVITKNDNNRGCYNGESGFIRVGNHGAYSVELDDGRCFEWSEYDIPDNILPGYAITVHRSQGSEYDSVIMYVPRCSPCLLHRNALYTGISRAKKQLLLYGDPNAVAFGLHNLPARRNSALVDKTLMLAG